MWRGLWARAGSSCITPAHTLAKIHPWTRPTPGRLERWSCWSPGREDTKLVSSHSPDTQGTSHFGNLEVGVSHLHCLLPNLVLHGGPKDTASDQTLKHLTFHKLVEKHSCRRKSEFTEKCSSPEEAHGWAQC